MPVTFRRIRSARSALALLLATSLLLLAAACGGSDGPTNPGGDGEPEPPEPPAPSVADAPTAGVTDVTPLVPVVLGGLPAGRTDLYAELAVPGGSTPTEVGGYTLPLVPRGGTNYALTVALHPSGDADGGAFEVRVRGDADWVTEPLALTLLPLPEAPGAFSGALAAFQEALDRRFAALGTTREAVLAADWETELDPSLYPAAVAQTLLNDPTHDRDLGDLLAGSSSLFAELGTNEVDAALLDRLAAAGGLDALFAELLVHEPGDPSGAPTLGAPGTATTPAGISISSAADLDGAMNRAWAAAREIDPSTATGELLQAYGLTLGALGLVTGPQGAAVTAALGSALWAYQTYLEGQASLLPRHFVDGSLSFDLDIPVFEEDRPGPATWSNVRVSARSEGWKLDKVIVDFLLNLAGSADAYAGWVKQLDDATESFVRSATGWLFTTQIGKLPVGQSGFVEIPPETWADIDVSGEPWSEGRLASGDAVWIMSATTLDPLRPGEALLTVETAISHFGDATPAFAREVVTVQAIEIDIEASATSVQPGEIVDLDITVLGALDAGLEWTLSAGASWVSGPTEVGDGVWTAQIQTPNATEQFPVQATFTSTATGGARDTPGAPERAATVRILSVHVIVDPPSAILAEGESQQFQAIVLGTDNDEVTWSAFDPNGAPAAIGANGLFTAPAEQGSYLVVATSVADPTAEGYANVTVVGECSWTLTIDGIYGGSWSGAIATHVYPGQFVPGPFIMTFVQSDESDLLGIFQAEGPGQGTASGSWSGSMGFSPGVGTQWTAVESDDPPSSATLTVTSNDGRAVTGTVTGQAFTPVAGKVYTAGFTLTFRSLNDTGEGACM